MRWMLLACLVVAGCGERRHPYEADNAAAARANAAQVLADARQACEQRFPRVQGGMAPLMRCTLLENGPAADGGPNSDIYRAAASQIVVVMGRFDRREIGWDVVEAENAKIQADVRTQISMRWNAQIGAAAAIAGSAPAYVPPQWPTYRAPVQTNCFRAGNTVTCSSY